LNVAFAIPYSYVGLAMATAASAALNAIMLGVTLHRERVLIIQPGTWAFVVRVVVAVVAMVAVVLWMTPSVQQWREMSLVARPWQLAQIIGVGAGAYLLVLLGSGLRPRHLRAQEY
ncbi:MAG: lipid II flippase MurJ, partial [Pseudomonadota bacterium]|nr:lipid II flippase MurJ [Pseudomonadota bacterium]